MVPTVIALAFYFCLADAVLILQCLYYNYKYNYAQTLAPSSPEQLDPSEDPRRPLLAQQASSLGLPGSRRRSSAASQQQRLFTSGSDTPPLGKNGSNRQWLINTASVVGVCLVGAVAWAVAWGAGLWVPVPDDAGREAVRGPRGAEMLGYASAICYLGYSTFQTHVMSRSLIVHSARLPQILKNYREKSCEGEWLGHTTGDV